MNYLSVIEKTLFNIYIFSNKKFNSNSFKHNYLLEIKFLNTRTVHSVIFPLFNSIFEHFNYHK